MTNTNIEDILEEEILNDLQYKYSTSNDTQTMFVFFLRSIIFYESNVLTNEQYIDFLLLELNLPSDLYYKNFKVSLRRYGDNNLQNIIDNFIYRYLESYHNDTIKGTILGKEFIFAQYNEYKKEAQRVFRSKKKKEIVNYKNVFKYFLLKCSYKDFNYALNDCKKFENFNYPENFILKNNFDFILKRSYDKYIDSEEKLIEKNLEDYICKHGIDDIKITNRQVKVNSGIIDLIGIDNSDNKVIIELKVVSRPTRLLWQVNSYTEDIKSIYKNSNIRTVVVAPKLEESILKQLPDFVEVYEFTKNKVYKFKKIKG